MNSQVHFFVEKAPEILRNHLPAIIALGDSEKEAVGFLPHSAFEDAIEQRRVFAMLVEDAVGGCSLAGYLLFGGIYPRARVQQIAVKKELRKQRIGSALLAALTSELERRGYLSIRANVASDLAHAQSFYSKHGFEEVSSKRGGTTRNRMIVIRVRELDTDHLFSEVPINEINLGPPRRFGSGSPLYTFDLNVFFDLVKNRARHEEACALFGAALAHRVRLGIVPEFLNELRRTSTDRQNDPVLQMALRLPRLPTLSDRTALENLADKIQALVFIEKNVARGESDQARSDALHLAHSALSRAAAFITSDKALLAARDELLEKISIDIASLEELVALLPDSADADQSTRRGRGFTFRPPEQLALEEYLKRAEIEDIVSGLVSPGNVGDVWQTAIYDGGRIVAIAIAESPSSIDGESQLLVHIEPGHLERELFVDFLIDVAVRQICAAAPGVVRLLHIPGQSIVSGLAKSRGFFSAEEGRDLVKVAIGHPVTQSNWEKTRHQLRRRTGLSLPSWPPTTSRSEDRLTVANSADLEFEISWERLEDLLSPTILMWPDREGVLVPIQRSYADELLGTATQRLLPFIESRDAAFLAQRTYVNTPKAKRAMRPGLPIIFYESGRSGGRSAAVAVGRIVDSIVVGKDQTPRESLRRAVVDEVSDFSSSNDVLLTTFDNLLAFRSPVPLAELRKIGAVGRTNLVSATALTHNQATAILQAGWTSGRT